MFIKYFNLLVVALLLFVNSLQVSAVEPILSTSVRKTANDSLNFTFYTNAAKFETPIVKDKGSNQYVILLPNFKDSSSGKLDLRTVSDIVVDSNIKTINEGAVTYTKVTIFTNKPVNVSVDTRQTSQSSKELSGVNDIIAKVNLINQDIQTSKSVQVASVQPVAVTNFASVSDVLNNQKVEQVGTKTVVETKKVTTPKAPAKSAVSVKSVSAHVPSNTKTIKKETKKLPSENIKNVQDKAIANIDKVDENIKSSVENDVVVNEDAQVAEQDLTVDLEPIPNIAEEKTSKFSFKSDLLSSPVALILFLFALLAFGVTFILQKMHAVLGRDADFSGAFIERLNNSIGANKKDFSRIAQNQNLSWQEKYKSFKTGQIEEQVKSLNSYVGIDADEDLDIVEDVAEELELLPDILNYQEAANPFASQADFLSRDMVVDSGDVISAQMSRTLKGFADNKTLSKTKRNVGLKNRFTSIENKNPEMLHRNIQELLETVIKLDEEKVEVEQVNDVQTEIANSFENTREIEHAKSMTVVQNSSSPIEIVESLPQEKRKLKIRESRAIDDNKGFYLVDMNDKLALMGRINDKFTVLKKFNDMDKNTLQVRRDKDNLYMVRTNGFKALVDVNEEKMGVFAEL